MPTHVLAFSGSLRQLSTNAALLDAAARLAPPSFTVERYTDLETLPHFHPDRERRAPLPPSVLKLRQRVHSADAIVIACPEYARGIPGSFKNALDWLVGSPDDTKLIALWNASPRAHHAQAALRIVLETMLGTIFDPACIEIPLLGSNKDAQAIAKVPAFAAKISTALGHIQRELKRRQN